MSAESPEIPMVRFDDEDWSAHQPGPAPFVFARKRLTDGSGGLGASLFEVPPGCAAYPRHAHLVNDEALLILAGRGRLRVGEASAEVGPGLFIPLPAGPEHAHRLDNIGDAPLRYICVSTMQAPEVALYPDSDKIGVIAGSPPGGAAEQRTVSAWFPASAKVGYFEGEG